MKTALLTTLLLSAIANANLIEKETLGECAIATFAKHPSGGLGIEKHLTRIQFAFPKTDSVTQNSVTGSNIIRYGVGEVVLAQNIEMMDAKGNILKQVPIKIALEVKSLGGNPARKVLRFQVREILNIFTGKVQTNPLIERETTADDTFLYPEFAITAPNQNSVQPGQIAQVGIICPFFTKDSPR